MKQVRAIIGFGFCGRLSLFHLVKKSQNSKILVFDKSGEKALGAAFSGFSKHYILNVPAIKMSAFATDAKDFIKFLEEKYSQILGEIGENGFAPRYIYGEYLQKITDETFATAKKNNIEIEFVAEEVVEICDEFKLKTESGKIYEASEIMIATSFKQSEIFSDFNHKNFIKKLWNKDALEFHQKTFDEKSVNQKICIIGSGLTAVDIILGLKKENFAGKIFVISRRGNFPKKHFSEAQKNPQRILDFISAYDAKKGVLAMALKIRKFLKENPQFDLRHVIDSMRSITVELWKNLDEKNKKLFLRFLPYWNIFRHRAPIASIELIEKMISEKQIEIKKHGVKKISQNLDQILIETNSESLACDYVINGLGFEFVAEKYPLFKQMIAEDLLKKDFFLVKSNNKNIHLIGGLNIGSDFECTAVPDLRANVEKVIKNL